MSHQTGRFRKTVKLSAIVAALMGIMSASVMACSYAVTDGARQIEPDRFPYAALFVSTFWLLVPTAWICLRRKPRNWWVFAAATLTALLYAPAVGIAALRGGCDEASSQCMIVGGFALMLFWLAASVAWRVIKGSAS